MDGLSVSICSGNNYDFFPLHWFTTSENIEKSFRGLLFLTHTVDIYFRQDNSYNPACT